MPSLVGMNIGRHHMGQARSKKSGSEFWRRWQGAKEKGYGGREAAAIAASEQAKRLREQLWPHLRRRA